MSDKVVMITGANSGIGKETAIQLAKKGATIIMVCRDRERGGAFLKEIKGLGNSDNVKLYIADLADQNSIRAMVAEFRRDHDKLHVLINNAGLILYKRETTPEGYGATFAINHLGHFLLTYLLLNILETSAPRRIINVSSGTHKWAKLNLDNIHLEENYGRFRAYGNSKLYNIMFTYELARRLKGSGISVNALHPGAVRTNFARNNKGILSKLILYLLRAFMISVEKGARTSIYLASSPEVENVTGKYFIKNQMRKSSEISYDRAAQLRLWKISEELTDINYPKYIDLETVESLLVKKAQTAT
jgi:NAD(P)-dependent dehydrogenase (short-subunit alcohol dehydrogenase family)